jgi:uncharacterized protein
MSRENVEIVRRGYELFAEGDLASVAALLSADVEVADAGGLGAMGTATGTRRGPEAFVRASQEALEAFEDYRAEAEEFIDAGHAVVVPVLISGRGRASGATLETRLVHVWVFRDGQIIRGEVYESRSEALEAVGLSE